MAAMGGKEADGGGAMVAGERGAAVPLPWWKGIPCKRRGLREQCSLLVGCGQRDHISGPVARSCKLALWIYHQTLVITGSRCIRRTAEAR